VQGIADDGLLKFSTPPPTLRQLFLIVLEMAAWINSSEAEPNVVLLQQSDLHTSNPSLVLACVTALMNRELFIDGAYETLPFIQDLASNYAYAQMSLSQERYLSYFN